jgi:hypothetical protein
MRASKGVRVDAIMTFTLGDKIPGYDSICKNRSQALNAVIRELKQSSWNSTQTSEAGICKTRPAGTIRQSPI